MGVKITWPKSSDSTVASYEVQRADSATGPWTVLATILNNIAGDDYDQAGHVFFYRDPTGAAANWYRLVATTVEGVRSVPSVAFKPAAGALPTAVGTARFVDPDGTPRITTLIISPVGVQTEGSQVLHNGEPLVVTSDANGRIEVQLLRGVRVRAAIEGTTFIKEFVVPDVGIFDIITAMSDAPDQFSVQEPEPFISRRSL